ncbi:uncharacterized protein LOC110698678 isoform X1 [Chenopodium quinoa]|uniref:Aspartate racemase n=2 Tax=Chenopodium quinoa TaxID=63459 RepID=A0A803LEE9_CHEQI|nr:uncharacterized protein LOC110698678 isoform X1 [Chenopodium quinoa]XP_021731869.1 uncharacterized protein LOC110698678 isoform X1 [Chenopodium quinoa]XP_021731870.1 uncharacterized protein LOC110698678 isoform X1 [Chenopodium quinoa]
MFDGIMTMSFHTLNYPIHFLGRTYKHGTLKSSRVIPALATPPSSILVHTGESDNSLKCGGNYVPNMSLSKKDFSTSSILNQGNAIGVIGGVSLDSTLNFVNKFARWGSNEGKDCPPFILCSDPQLMEELLIYERSSFPSLYAQVRPSNLDHTPIVENLKRKRAFLEQGGAQCLVMPCHLLHSWHADVSNGCSVTILHMAECVAKELKEAKLRPLETGCPLRIGVVGSDAVLKSGFYQEKLQNEGFEVVLPDKATMEHTVRPAIEALDRKDIEGARNLLRIALQVLLVRAVNKVIIASHEMHELLPHDDPLLKKCIDPIDALVRSTIKWSQSVERSS